MEARGLFSWNKLLVQYFGLLNAIRNSSKLVSLKLLSSQENKAGAVLEPLFNQHAACYLLKKRLQHRCSLVNFEKLLRTPFLKNTSGLQLLYLWNIFAISENLMLFSQGGFSNLSRHSYIFKVWMWNQSYLNTRTSSLPVLLIM